MITNLTINIFQRSDGEYEYNIYVNQDDADIADGTATIEDGGVCTSNLKNALEMAVEQARPVLKRQNKY